MLTQRALILKKAEYWTGRVLNSAEKRYVLRNIKLGTVKELKIRLARFNVVNKGESISDIVERHCKQGNFEGITKEKLATIMEELATRTWASVQHGMRLVNTINKMSENQLVTYIFNMYLKDIMKQERSGRRKVAAEPREPITNNQSARPPQVESEYGDYAFENAEKNNDITLVHEYDNKTQQLKNEIVTRRLHSEPKTNKKDEHKGILIMPNIGRPTGGDPNGDSK